MSLQMTQFCSFSWLSNRGFPGGSDSKESASNVGDVDSTPALGRSPGGGHGNPLQYCCLENLNDRGAWRAIQSVGSQSQTQLSDFHSLTQFATKETLGLLVAVI